MKQRLLILVLGLFIISGCKFNIPTIEKTAQETEPVDMPATSFSQLRIQANGPVDIKFVDDTGSTADPHALIEKKMTILSSGYENEEVEEIMQQALDSLDDNLQLSFSVADDVCTVTVALDPYMKDGIDEHTMLQYFYVYPAVTLVLVNVSDMLIEAQAQGKIRAEVDLTGAVLASSKDTVTFNALTQSSISSGSSITGDSLESSIIETAYNVTIGTAIDSTITSKKDVIADSLERVELQAAKVTAETTDNTTIVATGSVSIGSADGRLAVKTGGGAITIDEFTGAWFNLRQVTNPNGYSSGDITMYIADGTADGVIKTDSGDISLYLLDTLSCTVDLTSTKGNITIAGVEYYMVRADDNPDDWAQFTLNQGDGALSVITNTGDIDVEVADMFFPW